MIDAALPGWLTPRRLWQRIVLLFLGLLLLVQATGFLAIRESIDRNARATLARELELAERVWRRLLEQKAHALEQGTRVLAADFGFRSAIAADDRETLESTLENHAGRIGATASAWADASGGVRAVHAEDDALRAALPGLAAGLARQPRGSAAVVNGQPLQFVAVPVNAPLLIGWMVLGFPIDQAMLDDLRALSGMHAVLLTPGFDGRPRVAASTLATGPDDGSAQPAILAAPGDAQVTLADETMALRRVALTDTHADAELVLLHSIDAALAPYRQLQWLLAAITLAGVAVFWIGSMVTARRVTRPLHALVMASERLGRGEYDQPLQSIGRTDEVGELALAFDHMRVRIATHAQEIHRLAFWDRLTGLPNRAQFREALGQAIDLARPAGDVVAILMLDLDRFKHVNDVLGYALGDRLLQVVAQRLAGAGLHDGDLLARLAGDEFALLLPGSDGAAALAAAQRIGERLEAPFLLDDQTVDVSAAFGVAAWPEHADDAESLLSRAEVAMYHAKRKTTSAMVYDAAIDSGSALTLSLLSELRRALDGGQLRLFLQPKVSLADDCLGSAEALVRWQHPQRGMVPPMAFIPFAEQTGFVRQLTLWVFEETVRQAADLRACGVRRISINLSTRDLMDHELPVKLDRVLKRHGAPADAFCLEITESAIMDEPERAEATLNALSAAGFKLSIDDFGTGYSSLAYLKRLPVNELKIDKSFVMGMETESDDAKIVRSTIDLAHNLGLSVVAEGVETAEAMRQLRALGCDEVQGYHISRPLPARELSAFVARWAARRLEAAAA